MRWIYRQHRTEDLRGLAVQIFGLLKKSLKSSLVSQFGALLSQGAFKGLKKTIDYTEYGGAPLLGVRGVCVIGHGRSNANAVKNAIRVAAGLARARMNEKSNRSCRWSPSAHKAEPDDGKKRMEK
jgi:glycerol-3-phosphate acyltransferase PlsX